MTFAGPASADADKKDNHVDLSVYGKKLHVDSVAIWAGGPSLRYCLDARVTFTPPHGSPTIYYKWHDHSIPCGNGDLYRNIAVNTRWPNNTEVCATYYRQSNGQRWGGKPCATIHD